jgi:hypothetical protein
VTVRYGGEDLPGKFFAEQDGAFGLAARAEISGAAGESREAPLKPPTGEELLDRARDLRPQGPRSALESFFVGADVTVEVSLKQQGVAMLSSVLTSKRAVQVNIAIMRAFVPLREMLANHKELARKLDEMEKKYEQQFKVVFDAIRDLMLPKSSSPKRRIGFS